MHPGSRILAARVAIISIQPSVLMPCDPKGNQAHATLAMEQNQAHSYSHCSTDGAMGNDFPALLQCPSLVSREGCGSWRHEPACFSGECESSSSTVRLQTCLDTSMVMGGLSVGGVLSGVLWVRG
jgi:hypothetical protein